MKMHFVNLKIILFMTLAIHFGGTVPRNRVQKNLTQRFQQTHIDPRHVFVTCLAFALGDSHWGMGRTSTSSSNPGTGNGDDIEIPVTESGQASTEDFPGNGPRCFNGMGCIHASSCQPIVSLGYLGCPRNISSAALGLCKWPSYQPNCPYFMSDCACAPEVPFV